MRGIYLNQLSRVLFWGFIPYGESRCFFYSTSFIDVVALRVRLMCISFLKGISPTGKTVDFDGSSFFY